jgi:hypothetical protein
MTNAEYVAEASAQLDAHHAVVGVSNFGDDISDNCAVCGFAVGWRDDDTFGHTTLASVADVEAWAAQNASSEER